MKKFIFAALLAMALVALIAPPVVRAADDDKAFTIHGEVRFRGEIQNNADDLDDDTDDGAGFFPYRVRIAAEGKFSKNIVGWIEFQQTGFAGDRDPFNTDDDPGSDVQLYQGNMTLNELWSKNFNLRIGRQEIVAGNELVLGDEDFYNGISHDGGAGMWNLKNVNIMVWYTRPVEGSVSGDSGSTPDQIEIGSDPDTIQFLGGYATWTWKKDQIFDVYLMSLNDRDLDADFQTIGVRYARDVTGKNGFVWNIELAQQFGDADSVSTPTVDASGSALEGWFGYNWKTGANTHRVYARAEQATGDDSSTGDDFEGFIPLFGEVHNRTGRGDWFRLAECNPSGVETSGLDGGVCGGLTALAVGYNGFYNDRHEFGAQYWSYSVEEDNGSALGDDLGSAFDIWYGFNYSRNVNFTVSASQLAPDDALSGGAGSPDDSVTRVYGQARLRF